MAASLLTGAPRVLERPEIPVMQRTTVDDGDHIHSLWPWFEERVGLRGRKMYALIDTARATYTVCTPVREEDDPASLDLQTSVLPGGRYLRGRLVGQPPELYDAIPGAMTELEAGAARDRSRPLVEFYRRHDQVELWVPILL